MTEDTEALGLTLTDGKFQVHGYPDARRLVKLTSPAARRLATLRSHQSDLDFCNSVLLLLLSPINNVHHQVALYTALIVKFVSCFKGSGFRPELNSAKVFKGHAGALDAFRFYDTVRNRHLVHDENSFHQSVTCGVLGENDTPIDVLNLAFTAKPEFEQHGPVLQQLVAITYGYVTGEVDRCIKVVRKELHELTPTQKENLQEVSFTAPANSEARNTRVY